MMYGIVAFFIALALEIISLYSLRKMWRGGRLLSNVKHDVCYRLLYFPKLAMLDVSLVAFLYPFLFARSSRPLWLDGICGAVLLFVGYIGITLLVAKLEMRFITHIRRTSTLFPLESGRQKSKYKKHTSEIGELSDLVDYAQLHTSVEACEGVTDSQQSAKPPRVRARVVRFF
jgi:hypothetical protein